jgi:hypothetical protein
MADWFHKLWRIGLLLSLLLLTGCLQYDLDIQFDSQTHGQLVQQLRWRGNVAANSELQEWLAVLSDRTDLVHGRTQFLDGQTFAITIPFNNGRELESKFNEFFKAADTPFTLPSGDPITAEMALQQGNWLFAIDNHLALRIDLSAVPDLATTGLPLLQGQQLLDGQVTLTAPWVRSRSQTLTDSETWSLVPGEVNTMVVDFWVPSPIGIGAAVILLVVAIGYVVKHGWRAE